MEERREGFKLNGVKAGRGLRANGFCSKKDKPEIWIQSGSGPSLWSLNQIEEVHGIHFEDSDPRSRVYGILGNSFP